MKDSPNMIYPFLSFFVLVTLKQYIIITCMQANNNKKLVSWDLQITIPERVHLSICIIVNHTRRQRRCRMPRSEMSVVLYAIINIRHPACKTNRVLLRWQERKQSRVDKDEWLEEGRFKLSLYSNLSHKIWLCFSFWLQCHDDDNYDDLRRQTWH